MPKEYTIQDRTGLEVTFDWTGEGDPSESDMMDALTAARRGMTGKDEKSTLQRSYLYDDSVNKYAQEFGVAPSFVKAHTATESAWLPNQVSGTGASGLTQFTGATALDYAVKLGDTEVAGLDGEAAKKTLLADPDRAIRYGAAYLSDLEKKYGDQTKAAVAYNAGPANVDAAVAKYGDKWLEGMADYVSPEKYQEVQGHVQRFANWSKVFQDDYARQAQQAVPAPDQQPTEEAAPPAPVPEPKRVGFFGDTFRGIATGIVNNIQSLAQTVGNKYLAEGNRAVELSKTEGSPEFAAEHPIAEKVIGAGQKIQGAVGGAEAKLGKWLTEIADQLPSTMSQEAQDVSTRSAGILDGSVKPKDKAEVVSAIAQQVSQQLPQLAPAVLASALGGNAPVTGGVATAYGYAQEMGQAETDLKQRGIDDPELLQKYGYYYAAPASVLEGLSGMIGTGSWRAGKTLISKMAVGKKLAELAEKPAKKAVAMALLKGAGEVAGASQVEGITEVAQQKWQDVVAMVALKEAADKFPERRAEFEAAQAKLADETKNTFRRYFPQYLIGGLTGAAVSGGGKALEATANKVLESRQKASETPPPVSSVETGANKPPELAPGPNVAPPASEARAEADRLKSGVVETPQQKIERELREMVGQEEAPTAPEAAQPATQPETPLPATPAATPPETSPETAAPQAEVAASVSRETKPERPNRAARRATVEESLKSGPTLREMFGEHAPTKDEVAKKLGVSRLQARNLISQEYTDDEIAYARKLAAPPAAPKFSTSEGGPATEETAKAIASQLGLEYGGVQMKGRGRLEKPAYYVFTAPAEPGSEFKKGTTALVPIEETTPEGVAARFPGMKVPEVAAKSDNAEPYILEPKESERLKSLVAGIPGVRVGQDDYGARNPDGTIVVPSGVGLDVFPDRASKNASPTYVKLDEGMTPEQVKAKIDEAKARLAAGGRTPRLDTGKPSDPVRLLAKKVSEHHGLKTEDLFSEVQADTPQEQDFVAIANQLGREVRFFNQKPGATKTVYEGVFDPSQPGVVFLNKANANQETPLLHEIYHSMDADLRDVVYQVAKEEATGTFEEVAQHIAGKQQELTPAAAHEEVLANVSGTLGIKHLTSPGFWERLWLRSPDAFRRFVRHVQDVITRVRNAVFDANRQDSPTGKALFKDFGRVKDAMRKAVIEQRKRAKAPTASSGDVKYSKSNKGGTVVYHHSTEALKNVRDVPTGTWFTTNPAGYTRRPNAKFANKATIPSGLKLADGKTAAELGLYRGNPDAFAKALRADGYDGVKMSVDGETHYLILDNKNIELSQEGPDIRYSKKTPEERIAKAAPVLEEAKAETVPLKETVDVAKAATHPFGSAGKLKEMSKKAAEWYAENRAKAEKGTVQELRDGLIDYVRAIGGLDEKVLRQVLTLVKRANTVKTFDNAAEAVQKAILHRENSLLHKRVVRTVEMHRKRLAKKTRKRTKSGATADVESALTEYMNGLVVGEPIGKMDTSDKAQNMAATAILDAMNGNADAAQEASGKVGMDDAMRIVKDAMSASAQNVMMMDNAGLRQILADIDAIYKTGVTQRQQLETARKVEISNQAEEIASQITGAIQQGLGIAKLRQRLANTEAGLNKRPNNKTLMRRKAILQDRIKEVERQGRDPNEQEVASERAIQEKSLGHYKEKPSITRRAVDAARGLILTTRQMRRTFRKLAGYVNDADNALYKYILNPTYEARQNEMEKLIDTSEWFAGLVKSATKGRGKMSTHDISTKEVEVKWSETDAEGNPVEQSAKMNYRQMMLVNAYSRNANGLLHLEGTQYSDEQIAAVNAMLEKNAKPLVGIVDAIIEKFDNDIYPRLNKVFRSMYHADLPKEKSYFPIMNLVLENPGISVAQDLLSRGGLRAYIEKGQITTRVGSTKPFGPDADFFRTALAGLRHTEHMIAHLENVERINKILSYKNPKTGTNLREAIYRRDRLAAKSIDMWLADIALGSSAKDSNAGPLGKYISTLSRHTTLAVLAGNFFSVVQNVSQLSTAAYYLPLSGKLRMIGAAVEAGLRPMTMNRRIDKKSKMMRARPKSFQVEMQEDWMKASYGEFSKHVAWPIEKYKSMMRGLMVIQTASDKFVANIAWQAAYDTAIAKGKSEQAAIHYADEIIRDSQPSGDIVDQANIQRGGALNQLFVRFASAQIANMNILYDFIHQVRKNPAKMFPFFVFVVLLPALWNSLIGTIGKGGKGEEEDKDFADRVLGNTFEEAVMGFASGVPMVNVITRGMLSPYGADFTPPPLRGLEYGFKGIKTAQESGDMQKIMEGLAMMAGLPMGLWLNAKKIIRESSIE